MVFLRHGRSMRVMLCILWIILCVSLTAAPIEAAEKKNAQNYISDELEYHIVLDPGHGGNDSGADGYGRSESVRTLQLAKHIKKELEKYDHVRVSFTRESNKWVNLHDRMKIAERRNADVMVSLHFDSYSPGAAYFDGCSAFVAKRGTYRPDLVTAEVRLARSILYELEKLGLNNRGLVRKKSSGVPAYEDGSMGDYAAVVRDGVRIGIPAILIEHAFIDSWEDYNLVLASDKKLKKLARADADGIAKYLQLRKKSTGISVPPTVRKGVRLAAIRDSESGISMYRKRAAIAEYDRELLEGRDRYEAVSQLEFEEEAERLAEESRKKGEILREYRRQQEAVKEPAFAVVCALLAGLVFYGLTIDTHERYGSGPLFDPAGCLAQMKAIGLAFRELGRRMFRWILAILKIFWLWLCAIGNASLMLSIGICIGLWRWAKAVCIATRKAFVDIYKQI